MLIAKMSRFCAAALDGGRAIAKDVRSMHTTPLRLAPIGALLLLAGCNSQPTTITAGDSDPTANQVAAAPPVKLPPALLASKQYRCKDNSVVYVDFFNDGLSANFKAKKDDVPTKLTAASAGAAFEGEGYSVKGSPTDKVVSIARPGKGAQECDA